MCCKPSVGLQLPMILLRLSRELSLRLRFVRFVRFEVPRFGGFVRIGTPPFDTGLLDAPVVQAADAESGAPARLPVSVSPAAVVISRTGSRNQSYSVVLSRN